MLNKTLVLLLILKCCIDLNWLITLSDDFISKYWNLEFSNSFFIKKTLSCQFTSGINSNYYF